MPPPATKNPRSWSDCGSGTSFSHVRAVADGGSSMLADGGEPVPTKGLFIRGMHLKK
jgi:hypothetical protein